MSETWLDVVRLVFPEASDKEADSLLWNRTGFPAFWNRMPPKRAVLNSLRSFKRAIRRGHPICDLCEHKAVFPPSKPMSCARCSNAIGARGAGRRRREEAREAEAAERSRRAHGAAGCSSGVARRKP